MLQTQKGVLTMTKKEQKIINNFCEDHWEKAMKEFDSHGIYHSRLRTCQAYVYETRDYYILRSYETLVACIHKDTDNLIDVLRMVYGYTSTSAQHIAKFSHDYGRAKYGTTVTDTWRWVS